MERPSIKGLIETLGEQGKIDVDRFRAMQVRSAMMISRVIAGGGNIHGINEDAADRRHRANKAARKARRKNR